MRSLSPLLKAYIDKHYGAVDEHPKDEVPTQLLISAATALLGITIVDTDEINWIRSTVTKPWNEAWCADFVQSCLAYVEVVKGVVSPIPATEGVLDLWHRSQAYKTDSPKPGDIILWQLGTTLEGHCGIITGMDSLTYLTIEGNTSPSPGIVRDGNGVYSKVRAKGGTKTFTELGFLRCLP